MFSLISFTCIYKITSKTTEHNSMVWSEVYPVDFVGCYSPMDDCIYLLCKLQKVAKFIKDCFTSGRYFSKCTCFCES